MSDGGSFHATAIVFTYNNPAESGDELKRLLETFEPRYAVFQLERGAEGTPHYQGYVHFGKQRRVGPRFRQVFSGTLWCKRAKGQPSQNRVYCTKPEGREEGPWEIGECPAAGQGNRTDLHEYCEAVQAGVRDEELAERFPVVFARYPKAATVLRLAKRPRLRPDPPQIHLHIGKTGTGKTRPMYEKYWDSGELYVLPVTNGTIWFDGYQGEPRALLDDFAGGLSATKLTSLLQVLDKYPRSVPVKGSHVWWYPEHVHITTNIHPRLWYKWERWEEQYLALVRRFAGIYIDGSQEPIDPLARAEWEAWRPPPPEQDDRDPFSSRFR